MFHKLLLCVPVSLILLGRLAADEATGLANLDFENGKDSWAVWYSDDPSYRGPRFEWTIDKDTFKIGKAALKVVADDRKGVAFVHQSTKKFTKGARYELSYWIKFSSPEMYENCAVTLNLKKPKGDGKGSDLVQINPVTFYKSDDNGWLHRTGFFTVDKEIDELQLGLTVKRSHGTVWLDAIRLAVVPSGEARVESMYDYAPGRVELGSAMVKRFEELRDKKSPLLDRAKVYNRLLVDTALVADELRTLARVSFYLEAQGKSLTSDLTELAELEKRLDAVYRLYGEAFHDPKADRLKAFDGAADEFEARLTLVTTVAKLRKIEAAQYAESLGLKWKGLPAPTNEDPAISADGKPNQLIFGTVSPQTHYELEETLGVNRLYASSIFEAKGDGPGKYDFRDTLAAWDFYKRMGVKQSSIGTALGVHTNQVAPAWFLKKYADDPDIVCTARDGTKAIAPSYSMGAPLNTWRPEVRDMTADFIAQLGKTFKDQKQYLYYLIAPENGGPYFLTDNWRSIGYNKSALPDFRKWLERRYDTIENLNKQWHTKYKSFDSIDPPEDLLVVDEWPRPHPLAYEFQSWRNDHHHEWLKFLYDNFKKAGPNKAVMADHSALISQVDGSRIFDTVDILSVHQLTMLAPMYAYSMNRFAKKHLAIYENGWGFAEPMPHHASEVEQRAALTKYLYRLIAWGMHTQMWWYAYTQNDYMIQFNGNWFNPIYDLTTLRYSAAGLPVAKGRVKRLEKILLDAQVQRSRVVMLQPVTSMLFQNYWNESFGEMQEMHNLLYARNDLHEVLPETYFTDGRAKLDDYDVVILPYAPFFPDKLGDLLRDWVKKGGTLVALGPFDLYDKFGFDRADLWKDIFGDAIPKRLTKPYHYWESNREWHWGWEDKRDEKPVLEQTFGKGRVLVAMYSLRSAVMRNKQAESLVNAVESKSPRPASCSTNQFELTIQETRDGRKFLYAINSNVAKPVTDKVTLAGEYKSGIDADVPGGFPVVFKADAGKTTFSLRLEPGDFALIELLK